MTDYFKAVATENGMLDVLGVPFYGPENGGKDLDGQYFTPNTNFLEEMIPNPYAFYYHGAKTGSLAVPVGSTVRSWIDSAGKWFKGKLYLTEDDMPDFIRRMGRDVVSQVMETSASLWQSALDGRLFASSGAVPASIMVGENGEILQWLVAELSLIDADPSENRIPANFYASATPSAKYASTVFQAPEFKQVSGTSVAFDNIRVLIPEGDPLSESQIRTIRMPTNVKRKDEDYENKRGVIPAIASDLSRMFAEAMQMSGGDISAQDVASMIEDLVAEGVNQIDEIASMDDYESGEMNNSISRSVLQQFGLMGDDDNIDGTRSLKQGAFDDDFIYRAFEQPFLEAFQQFRNTRSLKMAVKNGNGAATPPATDTKDVLTREEAESLMSSIKSLEAQNKLMQEDNERLALQGAMSEHSSFLQELVNQTKIAKDAIPVWQNAFKSAFILDTATKSAPGEGMVDLLKNALNSLNSVVSGGAGETPPDATVNGDGSIDATEIKSGSIFSASSGAQGGIDHTAVDMDYMERIKKLSGLPAS